MRIVVGIASAGLVVLMLAEFFVAFLLPRRVKRDPRLARRFILTVWRPWRALASRLGPVAADTMLGIFGPLGLIAMLAFWSAGLILGFSGLYWATHAHLVGGAAPQFGDDVYFSAGGFFSASTQFDPTGTAARGLQIAEAASGFAVLFIAIGYLPALFQAFSRRETAVSQLDPRAGSPPSAGALLQRSAERGGWQDLDGYLREWENWAAELMETQLSYPALGFFRSQHVNQNWLAALTTVIDTCAFSLAFAPERAVEAAGLTFAIGRHALADIAHSFHLRIPERPPDRLPPDELASLVSRLEGGGLELDDSAGAIERLSKLRQSYERYAVALADYLALPLPGWLPGEGSVENWRRAVRRGRRDRLLP